MPRNSYIMRDQVRDQVREIMQWTPGGSGPRRSLSLGRIATRFSLRCLDLLADGLVYLVQPAGAARNPH